MDGFQPAGMRRYATGGISDHGRYEEETVAIDETKLTKGHRRKLNALRRSVGDKLGEDVFSRWKALQDKRPAARRADPVAEKIQTALADYVNDSNFRLGNYGYTIQRARGKGASGFVATKNPKPG